jgi:hypothetical protein
MLTVKILGTKTRQRYAVRRLVIVAQAALRAEYPDLDVEVIEVRELDEIGKYTPVMIAPGLVINEKLVYDLWIPSKEQVIGWMRESVLEMFARAQDDNPQIRDRTSRCDSDAVLKGSR